MSGSSSIDSGKKHLLGPTCERQRLTFNDKLSFFFTLFNLHSDDNTLLYLMNISEYNKFILFYISGKTEGVTEEEKEKFGQFINDNRSYIYSKLFFEYTQIEIDDNHARLFLKNVLKNLKKLEEALKSTIDFRVAFLDYLIRNISKITQASEPRIIEDKIFKNLNQLIVRDELTGLYNFRHYENELEKEFARAIRHNHTFSLVVMDIDDFKLYNDSYGHIEGNIVLKQIASIILDSVRISDIPCRYGGEEFALILPQTSKDGAFILTEKIREAVAGESFITKVSISGGISEFPLDTDNTDRTLFTYADKALYYSKEKGKNLITKFTKDLLSF
ncbi:MAG: diguanylate cyclase [Spirochaetales bacterium]|nr:diguanylate cyclase [Spirochaetales bacterium]